MSRPMAQLGDTDLQRARGVARAYRTHLRTANRPVADALDAAVNMAGEGWWLVEQELTVDCDDLVGTVAAAQLANVRPGTIRQWRKRGYIGRDGSHRHLTPRRRDHRGWPLFLAADILEIAAVTRSRRQGKAG